MQLRDHDRPCEHSPNNYEQIVWRTGHFVNDGRLISGDWCPGGTVIELDIDSAIQIVNGIIELPKSVWTNKACKAWTRAVVNAALGIVEEDA